MECGYDGGDCIRNEEDKRLRCLVDEYSKLDDGER